MADLLNNIKPQLMKPNTNLVTKELATIDAPENLAPVAETLAPKAVTPQFEKFNITNLWNCNKKQLTGFDMRRRLN
jgi:hypothetical protein